MELRRLLVVHEPYALQSEAERLAEAGRYAEAGQRTMRAWELAPDNHELRFWAGLGMAQGGLLEAGVEQVRTAIVAHRPWRDLLERLPPDVAPAAPDVLRVLRVEGG